MACKVSQLPPSESMTPEQALDISKAMQATDLLVIGFDHHGEFFLRSSRMDRSMAHWLITIAGDWILRETEPPGRNDDGA